MNWHRDGTHDCEETRVRKWQCAPKARIISGGRSCGGRGHRIDSRAAEFELDPRCPLPTRRRHKLHSSEPGARPLARGGPGDQTFAPSASWFALTATCHVSLSNL